MSARQGSHLTPDCLPVPSGPAVDVLAPPGPSGTVVYDYGILHADDARTLHCPCGRTDYAGRAEDALATHLASAAVGTRAVILARGMANDGTTGPAYLYALAERAENGVIWPTYQGSHAPGNGEIRKPRSDDAAPPAPAGRPTDPGSATIVRTA